ncbi:MAG: sigma-70 family RNA polymerase sigma factor [Desulfovibrionaceae bacterium]
MEPRVSLEDWLVGQLKKVLEGDSHAFGDVASRLGPMLLRRAESLLRSRDQAQDAVQESLLIAFNQLPELHDLAKFRPWMRTIVDSQCSRIMRARHKDVSLEALENTPFMASSDWEPASTYERLCLNAAFDKALLGLSLPLRQVCRLYYQEDCSIPEIAEYLRLAPGTVRKRLHSAQPALSRQFSAFFGDVNIKVGYLPISDHLLAMVAHRMAAGRNSRIRMQRFLSWTTLSEALEHGHIDAAFIMAPLAMRLFNAGVGLHYILDGHHDGSSLSTSTDNLQGKRVGVPGRFSTHRALLGSLAEEHPKLFENVRTADVNPSYAIRSLKRRSIDAFFCAEPWSTICTSEGGGQVLLRSRDISPGHPCCIVVVREEFCASHGSLVRKYVQTLLQARAKIAADPIYAAETQALYTGVHRDLALRVLEQGVVTFDDLQPDQSRMKDFMRMVLKSGALSSACDLSAFIGTDFS